MSHADCSLVVTKQNSDNYIAKNLKYLFQEQNFLIQDDRIIYSDSHIDNETERCLAGRKNTDEID